jgi:hypothetical protein
MRTGFQTEDGLGDEEERAAQDWLRQRLRPGNWLDVDPDEDIPPEVAGWSRTLAHMHQICFSPEIRRRRDAGALPDDFLLWGAQLLQPHEGQRVIRINEEVRGVPYLRTGRAVEKGEPIRLSDLAGLEYFDLEDNELDCGHFTVFWTGTGWIGAFDFRAGRAKSLSLIEKSLTFVAATRLCVKEGLAEPAIDTLHTACELLAKTRLILAHVPAHKWRSHGSISSAINREGRLGNIDPAFLALFNRLSDIRGHAKYAAGYSADLPAWEEIDLVENMALGLQETVKQKRPDDGN